MAVSVTDHFGFDKDKFDETNALDTILDVDSLYFLDPKLLMGSKIPEFENAYDKLTQNFSNVFKLLSESKTEGDRLWDEAYKRLPGGELKGLNLGYSSNTDGSGFGPQHRTDVLKSAKLILDLGVKDPTFFELVGVFEKGIGSDRISDLVCQILKENIVAYSERIFKDLGLEEVTVFRRQLYKVPRNPITKEPVLLLPKELLSDLPVAESWEDIDLVCATNQQVRDEVNSIIGDTWKTATARKDALKEVITSNPDVLKDLMTVYKNKEPKPYSFENDANGEITWYEKSKQVVEDNPLTLGSELNSIDDVVNCVREILMAYKRLVENNGLYELLYRDNACTKPKPERAAQKLLFGVADQYCRANNIDISPEVNVGRGSVDFKFSRGFEARVIVEVKKTDNSNLVHGYETQLEEYRKAEGIDADQCFYMPIGINSNTEARFQKLDIKQGEMIRDGVKKYPEIIKVDATYRASASKF
jgi:hypothetical protein